LWPASAILVPGTSPVGFSRSVSMTSSLQASPVAPVALLAADQRGPQDARTEEPPCPSPSVRRPGRPGTSCRPPAVAFAVAAAYRLAGMVRGDDEARRGAWGRCGQPLPPPNPVRAPGEARRLALPERTAPGEV